MCSRVSDKKHGDDNVTMMLDTYFRVNQEEVATLPQTYKEYEDIIQTNQNEICMLVGGRPLDLDEDELAFLDRECLKIFKELYALAIKIYQSDSKASAPEPDTSKDKRARDDSQVEQSQMSPDKKTKRTPPSPKTPASPKDGKEPASPLPPKTKIDHHAFPRVRPNYVDPWPFISDWNPMCDACGKVFDDHSNVGRQIQFHKGRWCRNTRRIYQSDMTNNAGSYNVVFVDQ
jgi:hypothetical protein